MASLGKNISPTLTANMDELINKVDNANFMNWTFAQWRKELAWQCNVYVFGEHYIAKRFYQIHYCFCDPDTAKDIVTDNLYALLRNKYFKKQNDVIDEKIRDIVKNFTMNLASTLKRASFDKDDDCDIKYRIPDGCVAFKNGVFNFKTNKWLFKYDIEYMEELSNRIYSYDDKYIIQWYMNFDFEPLDVGVMDFKLEDFVDLMKEIEEPYKYVGLGDPDYNEKNMCFELVYNMAHNEEHEFDIEKFKHLCEILGYLMHTSFLQYFVILIGSGGNGKNSLLDGCFTHKVIPMPTQNSMNTIETDKFITGTLENKYHNIYLETDEKAVGMNSNATLKALTGSPYQTIEPKGVGRYSGEINCKYIFSLNEPEKLKFSDTSEGLSRRVNVYQVFYKFEKNIEKMKKRNEDYYFTPFRQDLKELKENPLNIRTFVYLAMFGIKEATKNFTSQFAFTKTDWSDAYSDLDLDVKEKVQAISLNGILSYMKATPIRWKECQKMFYDSGEYYPDRKPQPLFKSTALTDMGYGTSFDELYSMLSNQEDAIEFFSENDVYINMVDIQNLCNDKGINNVRYVANFKKIFPNSKIIKITNRNYVLCRIVNNKIKIVSK